jgi:hypothetical protein
MRTYQSFFVTVLAVHPLCIIETNFDPGVGLGVAIDFHLYAFGKGIVVSGPPALTKSSLACVSMPSICPLKAYLHVSSEEHEAYSGYPDQLHLIIHLHDHYELK